VVFGAKRCQLSAKGKTAKNPFSLEIEASTGERDMSAHRKYNKVITPRFDNAQQETVIGVEREDAQDGRPTMDKIGNQVSDLLGKPICCHRRG
jgi:hypothetical protein